MKKLNSIQFDEVVEQYAEIVLDRMDYKSLEQYVYDSLIDYYGKMSQTELREHINEMEDELGCEDTMFDELVDNVGVKDTEPVVINLPEGTNLTRVTRTGVELEDVDDSWYDENGGLKHD